MTGTHITHQKRAISDHTYDGREMAATRNNLPHHDLEYDESRGGARDRWNWVSAPADGYVYLATRRIWHWKASTREPGRQLIPSLFVERIVKSATVSQPEAFRADRLLEKALDVDGWLGEALEVLVDELLFHDEDEDGNLAVHAFDLPYEIVERADKIIRGMPDNTSFHLTPASLEWLEGYSDRPQDAGIKWLARLSMADVLACGDLSVYTDLNMILGARSTEACRIDPTTTFHAMVGAGSGGQLAKAVQTFYYGASAAALDPAFLLARLPSFLRESQWQYTCMSMGRSRASRTITNQPPLRIQRSTVAPSPARSSTCTSTRRCSPRTKPRHGRSVTSTGQTGARRWAGPSTGSPWRSGTPCHGRLSRGGSSSNSSRTPSYGDIWSAQGDPSSSRRPLMIDCGASA